MVVRHVVCLIGAICLPAGSHAQSLTAQTTWINDHAQFVIQSIDADGRLAGTYTNYGPAFGCAGQPFPVIGWVDGDKISYTVCRKNPGNCTAIQAWTGFVKDGELLVDFHAIATEGGRTGVLRGSDRYRRQ